MNRFLAFALVGLGGSAILAGCPIYGSDYADGSPTTGPQCSSSADCDYGATCGSTNVCYSSDCTQVGCSSGYQCLVSGGSAVCTRSAGADAGKPDADGGKQDTGAAYSGCVALQCAKDIAGGKCLNNVCKGPDDQCSDGTQCASAQRCAEGLCSASCSASKACSTGYGCNLQTGVCSQNPAPCGSNGATCGGGAVCVSEHCVDACGPNNACASGLLCVAGGCVPDQRPTFSCTTDGEAGTGSQGSCAIASVCVRKSCYIACDPASTDACKNADQFNQCKAVATKNGTYNVCGSSSNLGSECDPSGSKTCASNKACIDGYCR